MPTAGPPTIETARLRLRPLLIAETISLNRIQSDPDHMQFYPHPLSLEDSRRWIERMQEWYVRDGISLLAVEDRQTNEFLKNVGLIVQTVDGLNVLLASLNANIATVTPSTPARCHSRP